MRRALRYIAIALALLLVVLAALVAYVAWGFDANSLKPRLAQWMQARYQRQLHIGGPIELKWWPRAHLALREVTLSERGSANVALTLPSALVTVRWWPLLHKEVVAEALTLEGVSLRLARDAQGHWNIDDLLRSEGDSGVRVDIAQLTLRNARIELADQITGMQGQLSNLQLTASPVAADRPGELAGGFDFTDANARRSGKVSLTSAYLLASKPFALTLSNAEVKLQGRIEDVTVDMLRIAGNGVVRDGGWESSNLQLQAKAQQGGASYEATAQWQRFAADAQGVDGRDLRVTASRSTTASNTVPQTLSMRLDRFSGRDDIAAPSTIVEYSAGGARATLQTALAYNVKTQEWRANAANLDATWQAGKDKPWHLNAKGEVLAQPTKGEWLASDIAFQLDGLAAAQNVRATGVVDLSASAERDGYSAAFDTLEMHFSDTAGTLQLRNTRTLAANIRGSEFEVSLDALRIDGMRQGARLTGEAIARVAGDMSRQRYVAKPLRLRVARETAAQSGAQWRIDTAGEANYDAVAQRLQTNRLQVNGEWRDRTRRVTLSGKPALNLDLEGGKSTLQLSDTQVRINSLVNTKLETRIILDGVYTQLAQPAQANFSGGGRIDDSKFSGRVAWRADGASAYEFDLDVERLDWDRYAAIVGDASPAPTPAAKSTRRASGAAALDLAWLRALRARGTARIGILHASGVSARQVVVQVQ